MEAGRKTHTIMPKDSTFPLFNKVSSNRFRLLEKSQLGGVIFGCTHSTIRDCLDKQLFGSPAPHIAYVKNIEPGLPLFLFNYSSRKLHGIFEASSSGQLNIDEHAWTHGSQKTSFPAQVKIRRRLHCRALYEDQLKHLIKDNYNSSTSNYFWFELDLGQTNKLLSALSSRALAPSAPQRAKDGAIPNDENLEEERLLEKRSDDDFDQMRSMLKEIEDLKVSTKEESLKTEHLMQKMVNIETEIENLKALVESISSKSFSGSTSKVAIHDEKEEQN